MIKQLIKTAAVTLGAIGLGSILTFGTPIHAQEATPVPNNSTETVIDAPNSDVVQAASNECPVYVSPQVHVYSPANSEKPNSVAADYKLNGACEEILLKVTSPRFNFERTIKAGAKGTFRAFDAKSAYVLGDEMQIQTFVKGELSSQVNINFVAASGPTWGWLIPCQDQKCSIQVGGHNDPEVSTDVYDDNQALIFHDTRTYTPTNWLSPVFPLNNKVSKKLHIHLAANVNGKPTLDMWFHISNPCYEETIITVTPTATITPTEPTVTPTPTITPTEPIVTPTPTITVEPPLDCHTTAPTAIAIEEFWFEIKDGMDIVHFTGKFVNSDWANLVKFHDGIEVTLKSIPLNSNVPMQWSFTHEDGGWMYKIIEHEVGINMNGNCIYVENVYEAESLNEPPQHATDADKNVYLPLIRR